MTKVRVRDVVVVGFSFAILLVILLPSLLLTNRLSVNMIIIYDVKILAQAMMHFH